jgi:ElaB/YqjD/DUF883 family membrane-anchored ribosome-binding protein
MANSSRNSINDAERLIRETRRDFDERIDAVRKELREKGPEAIETAERSLGDLKAGFESRLSDVREGIDGVHESFDDAVETGRSSIQERPLIAVGIALAAGVMIGMILGRKKRD